MRLSIRPDGIDFDAYERGRGMTSTIEPSQDTTRPLSQSAYDRLRAMILSGELRPGERLGERELARRVNMSRTPLREALSRLERDGLAVSKPGQGFFAVEFDPAIVGNIFEFREVLELHSCRAAAERISEAGVRRLADIRQALALFEAEDTLTADQLREEVELGFRVHEIIAQEAGNPMICETLMQLYDQLRLLTWIDVLWIDKWPETRREHRDLVAAVSERDAERAVAVARSHLQRSKTDALRVVEAQRRPRLSEIGSRPFVRIR
jgi:DNA-binding GntR family transcriptional regulator